MKFITVQVNAILDNGTIQLLDRHGKRIGKRMEPSDVHGELPAELSRYYPHASGWEWAAERMRLQETHEIDRATRSPWHNKAFVLAKCFSLRRRDIARVILGRRHHESYATATWLDATRRMYMQAANKYTRASKSGWEKWADCCTNNFSKKQRRRKCEQVSTRQD